MSPLARFAPRSLFSRLVLVQLTVLVAALLMSFALHMHERGEALSQASGMQAAERIADIVKLLEPLAPDERRRIVRAFSAPPLTISLDQVALAADAADSERGIRAAMFGAMMRRFLGDAHPVSVAVDDEGALHPPMREMAAGTHGPGMGVAGMNPRMMSPGGGMHFGAPPGFSFVAQVKLADGALVTFDSRVPAQTAGWPYRLLGSLVVLFVAVVGVSLVAVRWTTRPLKALADAADALGRDIDRPPMSEAGPVEVRRAARAFNTMQERLGRYVRERTATLAAMSHDLKTPVSRLRLRAELLEDNELKKKIAGDLAEMESMILGTLEFMRAGESAEKAQPVDVDALLESLAADARDTGADVTISGSATTPYVGRPQALKRCLGNLLDNGIKYGSAVAIVVEDHAERLLIRVGDRGPGIPEGELERVFEPFHRLESSRNRDTGGTGLGLSIARQIARLHHGSLVLRNRPGSGLEAVLELPREPA